MQWGIQQAFSFDPSHTSRVKEAMHAVKGAIPLVVNVGVTFPGFNGHLLVVVRAWEDL